MTLKIRTLLSSALQMPTKLPKNYKPTSKEKYMCAKHKAYFKQLLFNWKKELIEQNNRIMFNDMDDNSASADIVDQATSVSGKIEIYSIDEAFVDLSHIKKLKKVLTGIVKKQVKK